MVLTKEILLKSLLVLTTSIALSLVVGCAPRKPIVLHPIEKADIFSIETGASVHHADGRVTTVEKNGYFLSDLYFKEVINAKVQ